MLGTPCLMRVYCRSTLPLEEHTLKSLDPLTGAVTPPNSVRDSFVHFTCEKNDSSLNGQDSFHATQVTSASYMPIIQNQGHEYDTLNTVIIRCRKVAQSLGQIDVVLTVDEALYWKFTALKWVKSIDFLIVSLGGLHTAMGFMKVIGKHIQSSG